ncbi:TerC family protein [Cohnella faecalis]|uniref:TerC family protein n=1 Tax=Cohnella faecalis TaxID=2315694 RepID=A0A398CPB9_9BACL|nr:TerC family protein [Cohnella faecalis]RIE04232.1 TerC family protein [Cohnella faecalis]
MGLLENVVVFIEIVLINLLLSGDNAVVIAMAGRRLPADKRRRAVWWGAAAAVMLRIVLTLGAVALLHIPFLQTVGAVLLFVIALQLIAENKGESAHSTAATTLAGAVWTIVVADFVMSLDNVLAVAAIADGDVAMLVIGIAMSIPIIIWGSSFIMSLIDRIPALVYVGGALLGYAAGEMALKDPGLRSVIPVSGQLESVLPFALVALLMASALIVRAGRSA